MPHIVHTPGTSAAPDLSAAKRRLLDARLRGRAGDSRIPRRKTPHQARPSFAQERFWFLDRVGQGGVAYHQRLIARMAGALDLPALERALGEVVQRHESLRTTFREIDGVLSQMIAPRGELALPISDLSTADEADRDTDHLQRIFAGDAR